MDIQQLQKALSQHGYKKAAFLLPELKQGHEKLETIAEILEDCHAEAIDFSYDIGILYSQVSALSAYQAAYQEILLRDLGCLLREVITPTNDMAAITLDKDELQEAITLYQNAMQGDSEAQLVLGKFYKSIGRDDWAFVWYNSSANAVNIDAIFWVGNYYFDGIVVDKNIEKAFACYKDAALKGHPDAMNNYADMYLHGEYVEKDDKRAFELFSKAAELGVAESMYTLGYLYKNGIGTEANLTKSKHWYIQSALRGDDFAANHLGQEAFENDRGEEAISWFAMAADRQDVDGEFNLGFCYEAGVGTPINLKKAKYWYKKAALKGDKEAQMKLKGQ
ncbi:sel1 repeat family protein [Oceanobacillus zhaokaii]|uniref:Sel1 repeat family protein n=1 Tax=Oceanobacillus zhaokaii TaxID=2052660 RepID=A0A345PK86_9BACI|nr:tetratricopeptide repeat protein [Oceanobacillus zhaokaii]AXI10416.1 sel1 repeat family protein [Oceanobacillus zhaokaii]